MVDLESLFWTSVVSMQQWKRLLPLCYCKMPFISLILCCLLWLDSGLKGWRQRERHFNLNNFKLIQLSSSVERIENWISLKCKQQPDVLYVRKCCMRLDFPNSSAQTWDSLLLPGMAPTIQSEQIKNLINRKPHSSVRIQQWVFLPDKYKEWVVVFDFLPSKQLHQ